MIAAIYARKSTEQAGVSDEEKSVARQIDHACEYAARKGWRVADEHVYVDDGISGAEFAKRPGLLRLMDAVKPRAPFNVLVMSEESRLGREAIETAYVLKQLVTAGVRVFFYLEDRERTLDSPIEKIMLSLTAFADELERERARQRTADAMTRKARAGHVTGGRVFGYDNVDVLGDADEQGRRVRRHVERRVNDREADVVRRIFDLCAAGGGVKSIAIALNDSGAPSPRAQQGRPRGWAPSSVREALYRDLYRGQVIYNRTRKRDQWGRKCQKPRPETEWLRRDSQELRIVTDEQWNAAHDRLAATRQTYLRGTAGLLWGRPATGTAAKYLLTGLARCGECGGGLLVKSRQHGRRRNHRYGCSSYHMRGRSVCDNGLELPLLEGHELILDAIEEDVLAPDIVGAAVDEAMALLTAPQTRQSSLGEAQRELRTVESELRRLTAALAGGAEMDSIVAALRERETRRATLQRQLDDLNAVRVIDPDRLRREMLTRIDEWRAMFRRQLQFSRQVLQKLLVEKIVCRPTEEDGVAQYEITMRLSFGRIFAGILCPSGMASPAGLPTYSKGTVLLRAA